MKKIMVIFLLVVLAMLPMAADAWRDANRMTMSWADTLGTGTSADTIYSGWIHVSDYDYMAASIMTTVTSGGGSGGAVITVEGRVGDLTTYETLWFIDISDSMNVAKSAAISGTSSLLKTFVLTAPAELKTGDTKFDMIGLLPPCDDVRIRYVDTDWNADADPTGYWTLKRK